MNIKRFSSIITLAIVFLCAVSVRGVYATPILEISDGMTTVTVADGGAGDLNSTVGVITYISPIGSFSGFSTTISTGFGVPEIGGSAYPTIHLDSSLSSAGLGVLTIKLTETGYLSLPPLADGFYTNAGGVTGGTVEVASYADTSNDAFGTGTSLSTLGPYSGGAFSGTDSSIFSPPGTPFSLTLVATVTHSGAAITSFNAEIIPTPEPGTLLLLGSGLLGLGGWGLRTRKRLKNI